MKNSKTFNAIAVALLALWIFENLYFRIKNGSHWQDRFLMVSKLERHCDFILVSLTVVFMFVLIFDTIKKRRHEQK